jgi:hypothetical protein
VINKPQRRRPRLDLGCRAIGWMEIKYNVLSISYFLRNVFISASVRREELKLKSYGWCWAVTSHEIMVDRRFNNTDINEQGFAANFFNKWLAPATYILEHVMTHTYDTGYDKPQHVQCSDVRKTCRFPLYLIFGSRDGHIEVYVLIF